MACPTFHVYDLIEYPEEGHTATYGWFKVNLDTCEIHDLVMIESVY